MTTEFISNILTFIFNKVFQFVLTNKSDLVYYFTHASAIPLKANNNKSNVTVNSHTIVIKNIGNKTTKNIRIGHLCDVDFNIYPLVHFQRLPIANGGFELVIPTMTQNETLTISYLYFPQLTYQQICSYIKSDDGMIRQIEVMPTPILSKWKIKLIQVLLLIGLFTTIIFAYKLLMKLELKFHLIDLIKSIFVV
jgi:hypothetical protein